VESDPFATALAPVGVMLVGFLGGDVTSHLGRTCPITRLKAHPVKHGHEGSSHTGQGGDSSDGGWSSCQELPEIVAANFPVVPGKQSIFGHSMGGHGALTIAMKNPVSAPTHPSMQMIRVTMISASCQKLRLTA
jgi:hypothetical protein